MLFKMPMAFLFESVLWSLLFQDCGDPVLWKFQGYLVNPLVFIDSQLVLSLTSEGL